jgi:hypothetical protein
MFVNELKQLISALADTSLISEQTELLETAKSVLPVADSDSLLQ